MTTDAPVDLVIWGASGHARVVIDAVRLDGRFRPVALLDDRPDGARPDELDGVPVIGGRECLAELRARGVSSLIVAFGKCEPRLAAADTALAAGFALATIVHPRATIARNATIGAGSFVAAGAVINPGTTIGSSVIVNTSASIDHDCTIGDGAHICPGVVIAGSVTVGRAAWLGVGCVVSNGLAIGTGSTVGAGAVVIRDIPAGVVAYGVPAEVRDKG
jgi:UDP-N-acetylbacillosamine N-acetyltransferase